MKRWTNGLPGATKRLGAMMAHRGLSPSESWMRADTHVGPEHDAPLQRPDTLLQHSSSSVLEVRLAPHGRAIHIGTSPTSTDVSFPVANGRKADVGPLLRRRSITCHYANGETRKRDLTTMAY
jgi:hypothetical protein